MHPPSRTRPTRRQRRILARSRSTSSAIKDSHRKSYGRSQSCPEYPIYSKTYKITDNSGEHTFQMHLCPPSISITNQNLSSISLNREHKRTLPANIYYGPPPNVVRSVSLSNKKKTSRLLWHERAATIESDYNIHKNPDGRRRQQPNMPQLHNVYAGSLPEIPSVIRQQNSLPLNISTDKTNYEDCSQYHGYNSDGSEAETTIHVSIDKHNSFEVNSSKVNSNETIIEPQTFESRKKYLFLNLKASYEGKSPQKTQSLDMSCTDISANEHNNTIYKLERDLKENTENIKPKPIDKRQRRHSDSAVQLKTSPASCGESLSSPKEVIHIFKKMSVGSIKLTNELSVDSVYNEQSIKKHFNVVSINETPTVQEYCSPNSLSPPASIDFSLRKPLPSIIKKPRRRSYSASSTDHLDREFSIMANSMCVALSPSNLGSPHRALTPVASHPPLDDTPHHIDDGSTTDNKYVCRAKPSRDFRPTKQNENRRNTKNKKQSTTTKKQRGNTGREMKYSNDYGGRENGRNNNPPQPLERRESRRGQFTRSLSNADVPPDERAGTGTLISYLIISHLFIIIIYYVTDQLTCGFYKDGSLSDTALGGGSELEPTSDDALLKAEPRDYFGPGMGKKSNSTSQLSATGEPYYLLAQFHNSRTSPIVCYILYKRTLNNTLIMGLQCDRTEKEVRVR